VGGTSTAAPSPPWGRHHWPVECDQRDVEAPRDRQVQRVWRPQSQIKSPDIGGGKPHIHGMDFCRPGHRCSPYVKVRPGCLAFQRSLRGPKLRYRDPTLIEELGSCGC